MSEMAGGSLGPVEAQLFEELARARATIARAASLSTATGAPYAGEQFRGISGALEMIGAPAVTRFYVDLAELAWNGVSLDRRAAAIAQGCIAAVAAELEAGTAGPREGSAMLRLPVLELPPIDGLPPVGQSHPERAAIADHRDANPRQSERQQELKCRHNAYQRGLLDWLRGDAAGLERMDEALAGVGDLQKAPDRSLWRLASLFVVCLRLRRVAEDMGARKLCGRIEQQIRRLRSESSEGTAALVCDILEAIAGSAAVNSRAGEILAGYGLDRLQMASIAKDTAAADRAGLRHELRAGLQRAKGLWDQIYQGTAEVVPELLETLARSAHDAAELRQDPLQGLLCAIGARVSNSPQHSLPGLGIEVASALLVAESAGDCGQIETPLARALVGLTQRLSGASPSGTEVGISESPLSWRVTAESAAAREVLARLKHAEQVLAEFFHDRSRADELGLPGLPACIAVFHMLGLERAAALARTVRGLISDLAQPAATLTGGAMEELADGLSRLVLYCTALAEGRGGTDPKLLSRLGLMDLDPLAIDSGTAEVAPLLTQPTNESLPRASRGSRESEEAAELLAVFIEEAGEILDSMATGLSHCREHLSDRAAFADIRRAFHTLKGSSRMVGLTSLSQSAWAVEEAMNAWLDQHQPASAAVLDLLTMAYGQFSAWVGELERDGAVSVDSAELLACAAKLKSGDRPPASSTPALAADAPPVAVTQHAPEPTPAQQSEVVIGSLRIQGALFAIFLREAEEHHRRLCAEIDRLSAEPQLAVGHEFMRAAHTLASIARTAGLSQLAELAGALEQWLLVLIRHGQPIEGSAHELLHAAVTLMRSMLDAVAQQQAPSPEVLTQGTALAASIVQVGGDLAARLGTTAVDLEGLTAAGLNPSGSEEEERHADFDATLPGSLTQVSAQSSAPPRADSAVSPAESCDGAAIDNQLWPVFMAEAADFIVAIDAELRTWKSKPAEPQAPLELLRVLHNFKGSAYTAGSGDIGEMIHLIESLVEGSAGQGEVPGHVFDQIEGRFDAVAMAIERLADQLEDRQSRSLESAATPARYPSGEGPGADAATVLLPTSAAAHTVDPFLKVRTQVVERLLNQAGEISIGRSALETEMAQFSRGLGDLASTLARLGEQLRELEIQSDSQLQSRLSQLQSEAQDFDPLELDRYTRVQELTRMMVESVSDIEILHHSLIQTAERTATALADQGRLNRQHHRDLIHVRAMPLRSVAERLYRVVRQAGRELGKRVDLVIEGEQVEIDRGVLERLSAPLEHLLRNAVVHGIEDPEARLQAGKGAVGQVVLSVRKEATGIVITIADDGAGLDLGRLQAKAQEKGLIAAGAPLSDDQITQLIFVSGFSTAEELTGLAGRGVGMDAVLSAVHAAGGRIEVNSTSGSGARFAMFLPIMHSIVDSVLVRAGDTLYAIPAVMFAQVLEVKVDHLEAYTNGRAIERHGKTYAPVCYLPRLLGEPQDLAALTRQHRLLLLHEGGEHVAVVVDEVIGSREIIVKGVGPQLAGVNGVLGATALGDGRCLLIISPVRLARRGAPAAPQDGQALAASGRLAAPPLVMVVDDSLTVRKFTERVLVRSGYRVVSARDGVDAIQQIDSTLPDVILLDIEMPRMDGFELTRKLRLDARTARVPIIMITSRAADKHRKLALKLGVDLYLGKPYEEQQLLQQVAGFVARRAA